MEATTTTANRIVSQEFDHAAPTGASETEAKVIRVLERARVRQDRHMTRERIARELGAHGRAFASIYTVIDSMAERRRIIARHNTDTGETAHHLPPELPSTPPIGLFDGVLSHPAAAPHGPYKCPYCPEELKTENGRNVHIGRKHKGKPKPKVGLKAQAANSTPMFQPVPPVPGPDEDKEDDDDDDLPDAANGADVSSIAAMHKKLVRDAQKHGWTIEVLTASKRSETGVIRFTYEHATKVAS